MGIVKEKVASLMQDRPDSSKSVEREMALSGACGPYIRCRLVVAEFYSSRRWKAGPQAAGDGTPAEHFPTLPQAWSHHVAP